MIQVAVAIIKKNNAILACQRKRTAIYPLLWEFPGGKVEAGETLQQCLRRELNEELSIDAVIGEEIFTQTWRYPDSGNYEVHYFLVNSFAGKIHNNTHEHIRWLEHEDLSVENFLEGNKEIIQKLQLQK